MDAPPLIISPTPPPLPSAKKPFAFQAAQASLLAPVFSIGVSIFVNGGGSQLSPTVRIITGSVCILFFLLGFIFGIIALAGVRRYGKKGIFGRAIAGICINGILIAVMIISIPMMKKMAERAKEIQKQKMEQQQTQP